MAEQDAPALHGAPLGDFPLETWLSEDSDLAYVVVSLEAWLDAHPCECDGVCECET